MSKDHHNYTFALHSPAYAKGYDRIFNKKVKHGTKKVNALGGRRKVREAGKESPLQSPRRVHRTKEIREEENGFDGIEGSKTSE
jgi:hypothetical protein